MSQYFGKDVGKLGFGLMRLPKTGESTDVKQVEKMVDMFLAAGFTYFDTAYVYGDSEQVTKQALVDRHPRSAYTLATKLNVNAAESEQAAKKQFYTSLERTGAGYFDYYLLHALMNKNYAKYDEYHLWDFVKDQKAKGLIKHLGFSFHAGPDLLDKILTLHPEVEFVQLQINYADWENPTVASRANYEVARKHGKSIIIMEPVKGGALANPPKEAQKLFNEYNPDASCASWAIRFAASLDGIITVLSGMSNVEQMADNLSYMTHFTPLNATERGIIAQVQGILDASSAIPCTACHYCTDGCPKKIRIPEIFYAANRHFEKGELTEASQAYQSVTGDGNTASACVNCKQCEHACPQHLPITQYLKRCAKMFEK